MLLGLRSKRDVWKQGTGGIPRFEHWSSNDLRLVREKEFEQIILKMLKEGKLSLA